ncbi:MAG: ECF-type sigma factor [Pirellulaceae bacterium]|nr:hypothetical protein [Planctomycetales bacterium]
MKDSLQTWITRISSGDDEAADLVWNECYAELLRFAQHRLGMVPARYELAEDVALSSINSLIVRLRDGRLEALESRSELWKLLYTIAYRKIARFHRKKSSTETSMPTDAEFQLSATVDELQTTTDELLAILPDDTCRKIGMLFLSGFKFREIAEEVGCSAESVRRKVHLIRRKWENVLFPEE